MSGRETLLDRAISNYKLACVNYQYRIDDDFQLNLIGYLLQQSVELFLKHFIEIAGHAYPRSHDIPELISYLKEINSDIVTNRDLNMFAGTLTSWESRTRYIKNYFLEKDQIDIGLDIVKDLFAGNGIDSVRYSTSPMDFFN